MSTAPRYIPHYTLADYQQWDGDWELIDGVPIAMTPSPFGPHERVVARLARLLGNAIAEDDACDCEIYVNLDWIVSDDTVIRPDLMTVCGDQPAKHLERPPALLVEVLSESTRLSDLNAKQTLATQHYVSHYFTIDPELRTIQKSLGDSWQELSVTKPVEITLDDSCRVRFIPDQLFDRAK